jgi:hypothetical protein
LFLDDKRFLGTLREKLLSSINVSDFLNLSRTVDFSNLEYGIYISRHALLFIEDSNVHPS